MRGADLLPRLETAVRGKPHLGTAPVRSAIGSWLYRMDYGFWLLLTDGAGHAHDFREPFDMLMAFFFYVPNLLVAEAFIRARRITAPPALRLAAAVVLAAATSFLLLGTYFFTPFLWGPAILHQLFS